MACNGDYGDKTADEMKAIYARLASNSQQKVSMDTREVANEVGILIFHGGIRVSEVAINKWVHRVSVHLDLNSNNFPNNNITSKTNNNKTLNPNLKFKIGGWKTCFCN
ncbi:hypothetical protein COLO4_06104 [Corchorus olitorius]|uniref:Uncharacterized protein n=1 Tax=Corchorus olitorius TaxID=93759 RepID=A0A1R3KP05_9ROSI|nr:hypothetical protein COLO4_06104 [Corchorus olitorius]